MIFDVMAYSPFVSDKYKVIWKENLVANQMPLRAFFPHTPSIETTINQEEIDAIELV